MKANIASPVFTTQITTPKVILGSSDLQGLIDLKSPLTNPVFLQTSFIQQSNGYTICIGSLMTGTNGILNNREGMGFYFDNTASRLCGVIEPCKNNPVVYRNLVLCPNGASVGIGMYIPNSLYKLDVNIGL